MSNHSTIFLIDLGLRAAATQQALSKMGFQVGSGSHDQLAEVIGQALPHVVVAPESILSKVKATLESVPGGAEVLLFLLAEEGVTVSGRVPLGATARVPADIDAGVLGLRIQAAAQTSSSVRNRQATLVGFSTSDLVGVDQKAPSVPPGVNSLSSFPAAPASGFPAAPASGFPAAPISSPPVEASSRVVSSAPPLPLTPEPPPLGFDAPPLSASPPLHEASAASANPVALTVPPLIVEAPNNRKKLVVGSAAFVVLLVGVGAFALRGGFFEEINAKGESAPSAEAAIDSRAPATQSQTTPSKSAPQDDSPASKGAESAPTGDGATPPLDTAPDKSSASEPSASAAMGTTNALDEESAWFRIDTPKELKSCETLLGKSEGDFQGAAKWKSAQAWTLARKSLMSGKQEQAAKQMCESAFIDPKGPAVAGLVNYYLSEKALEQAHKWALRGVEASPKSRAAQESLGDVLNQMGRVEEAREVWLASFGLKDKGDAKLAGVVKNYVRSAVAARKGGAYPLAERLLRRALSFEPDNSDAVALFTATLRKNGEVKLAEKWESRGSKL